MISITQDGGNEVTMKPKEERGNLTHLVNENVFAEIWTLVNLPNLH